MLSILIVDDDEDVCLALSQLLAMEGYAALSAASGGQGLRMLEQHKPGVVVLDYALGDMTGEEFLQRKAALAQVARVPVILMTGHAGSEGLAGVDAQLRKPFRLEELVALVQRCCP